MLNAPAPAPAVAPAVVHLYPRILLRNQRKVSVFFQVLYAFLYARRVRMWLTIATWNMPMPWIDAPFV